jgi:hypothetical protein
MRCPTEYPVAYVTLVMVLANNYQTIMLADRRVGAKGRPIDEEHNKLAVFVCKNARVGVAFTGIATRPGFKTAQWLLEALMEAARPSQFLQPTVERLREIATRDIGALPRENPLTIAMAGYIYADALPLGCLCCISNFESPDAKRYGPVRPTFESYVVTRIARARSCSG